MNILIYLLIINRAIALKQSLDIHPEYTPNKSFTWTTSGPETVPPSDASTITLSYDPPSQLSLFNVIHLSGVIACGLSIIASTITIAYLFTNGERNLYKRKVKYKDIS